MKKLFYYALLMIAVVIVLPVLIVKGCGTEYAQGRNQIQEQGNGFDQGTGGEKGNAMEPGTGQNAGQRSPNSISLLPVTKISLYDAKTKKTQIVDIEEYIKCVVAAEMPVEFELEALKAQAVAARTYTLGRLLGVYRSKEGYHDGIDVCTDSTHCQAWISKEAAIKKWGILFGNRNWNKIQKAVQETKGIIATYDGVIANTLFHSNSGGKTENAEYVWSGVSVPYLVSMESSGEEDNKDYKSTVLIKNTDFIKKFKEEYPKINLKEDKLLSSIKILDYTPGGRVNNIEVGGEKLKGTDVRKILSLKSANFKIEKSDARTLKITVYGYGHGVGMSQWGANYMAKKGGTYDEILKYYYQGIQLIAMDKYK